MNNNKGGLIRKEKAPTIQPHIFTIKSPQQNKKLGVGKTNNTKSIKVPIVVHSEINLLGSFIVESKTYVILQKLIDSYVKNELTDRQKRQFEYMVEAFHEELGTASST